MWNVASELRQFSFAGSETNKRQDKANLKLFKVVRDPCQKITLLLLKSKSVRVIVPESCF